MSVIKPFKGLRPPTHLAAKVAGPPYDVLNRAEAKVMAAGNPISFLHINKPEIDMDDSVDAYDDSVYRKGAENLKRFIEEGTLQRDADPHFYLYRQIMGGHTQVGLVAAASVEEYEQNIIKKHEFTRPDKENDRVNHMSFLNAQVGPVFLTYKATRTLDALTERLIETQPQADFTSDNIQHTLWVVDDPADIEAIEQAFAKIPCLYVADGHHRSAAAMRVKQQKQAQNPSHSGEESYNFFLTVIFPHDQMQILDYNRVVSDLNGLSEESLLEALAQQFEVKPNAGLDQAKPVSAHHFAMYLNKHWYTLSAKAGTWDDENPVQRLDVSILQNNLLAPILGVGDPRTDKRIDFVGGIRGLRELEKRVDSGECAVAFALFPTSIEDLMAIADAGEVMPPKSTWFEPKLKSGLVVHVLD